MKSTSSFLRAGIIILLSLGLGSDLIISSARATDAPVIKNDSNKAPQVEVIELEEMWRAGGEDSDIIFGHIFRAEADAAGNVYLLDTQLSEVPVFSPEGENFITLSREGEGPGETREPADLTMMPDGTIGILQRFPGKIVKMTRDDVPAGEVVMGDPAAGGFNTLYTGRCRGSNLLLVAQYATRTDEGQSRTWYVSRFDAEGNELARCWEREIDLNFAEPVIRENDVLDPVVFACAAGTDGRVYLAPDRYNYAIHVYGPDGQQQHVIEKTFEQRQRIDIETRRIQRVFDAWTSQGPAPPETVVETVATTISALYIDDNNNLWVENSRSASTESNRTRMTYDIFNTNGYFKRQVAFVCEANFIDDQLFRVRDDIVVLIKGSIPALYAAMAGGAQGSGEETESEPMEVICYRIPRQ